MPVAFGPLGTPAPTISFAGIEGTLRDSAISGGKVVDWAAKPVALEIPHLRFDAVTASVKRPAAYWIPPSYNGVIAPPRDIIGAIPGMELREMERNFEGYQRGEQSQRPFIMSRSGAPGARTRSPRTTRTSGRSSMSRPRS